MIRRIKTKKTDQDMKRNPKIKEREKKKKEKEEEVIEQKRLSKNQVN